MEAIQAGLRDGICAWCQTPLASYPPGLLCPHLFLAHASLCHARALGELFASMDTARVIGYLRVVAECSPAGRRRVVRYEELRHAGRCKVAIYWRDRIWMFEFDAGAGGWPAGGASLLLTVRQRGKVVEQAEVRLPSAQRAHRLTVLQTRAASGRRAQ